MQHSLPIVITGHVDHGKSTFIGRLLYDTGTLKSEHYAEMIQSSVAAGREDEFAFVLDSFEEERRRGITIDTTQIFFKTATRSFVIIDAPGHREFIRNMLTGASYAEAAVLIIDATEGVMEQTRRHAWLLDMVGIRDICVVVNKMDAVGYDQARFRTIMMAATALIGEFSLTPIGIVPASARLGENVVSRSALMDWYDGPSVLEVLEGIQGQSMEERYFRFPVQDVYDFAGERLILGRVESGSVACGMMVHLLPQRRTATVAAIRKFPEDAQTAAFGEAVALKLTGTDDLQIIRGNVIVCGEEPCCQRRFSATIFWFHGEYASGDRVIIRCTTQAIPGSIVLEKVFDPAQPDATLSPATICVGEVAYCTVITEGDMTADHHLAVPELGRFIIENDGIPTGAGIFR